MKAKWTSELATTLKIDFISIQEHFRKNIGNFFHNQFPGFTNSVVPGVRALNQDVGWPMGGLAQLINIKYQIKTTRVATKSFRIQAQILKLQHVSVLLINSYSPTGFAMTVSNFLERIGLVCGLGKVPSLPYTCSTLTSSPPLYWTSSSWTKPYWRWWRGH